MIRLKYFTLEYLNTKIRSFPYQHSDRLDKPQPIPKNFAAKLSIGGNGHENSTLLRLLPLMVGSKVPEGDETWAILMDLKEIVQLVLSPSFTEDSIQYMQTKISDHRQGLQAVFPDFKLRPKHHYLEHYPELTRCFGPLVHLWTMRFEGKHRFFKRVIHDTQNFKNVLKTLATRHQHMMAYHLSAPLFFRPHTRASSVTSVQIATLPQVAKDFIETKTESQNIYSTSKVSINGTDFANGMFVSADQTGGLPNFSRIERVLLVDNSVSFLCRNYKCWYSEHLRSFELTSTGNTSVLQLSELNDTEMAAQNFLLHVHTSTDIVRKMTLSSRPESVDELKTMIGEKFNLDFNFSLSYQDPDFDGQLCSLLDIEELPQKAVLKVIRSESDASSVASDDTIILPHAMTPDRVNRWPDVFPVPIFSYEVEFLLSDGNAAYDRTGKTLKLSRGQKHDILETLAAKMHSFKAYPNDKEVSMVAEALVIKHPCLKEPGSQTGWYGWKNSLKFKMGNFRTKLSRAGFHEVAINSGKRSRNNPNKPSPHTNIKRPKRAEVNFLPNFPRGENAASLERLRLQIVDEVKKSDKNLSLIGKLMQTTFALRRNEIVSDDPPVDEILERWPALKMESQICAEFHRISNINLKNCFYAELDRHAPRLQRLFRRKAARTGKAAEVLSRIFQMYDLQEQVEVHVRRAAVLRALPAYLHDDDSGFLKQWDVAQSEPDIGDLPVGLLISATSDAMYLCPEKVAVVLEGKTVIDFPTFADAFVVLFALIYALHLNYPKDMANTFDFTQKVLMGLEDGNMRPRVLSLKNELLAVE
ncbi:uncharacterized protein LOC122971866 isoform X1 [Thunnus albacares]|uniref:uncharacterized protein LOC122971866 isoform X1 n=3 Tax=Thunnus albacares TaxID=8236 RepID=UPI001CF60799|nr:uncharacterized protein LOC122971866 isoform X1 [Thunnus albacares]